MPADKQQSSKISACSTKNCPESCGLHSSTPTRPTSSTTCLPYSGRYTQHSFESFLGCAIGSKWLLTLLHIQMLTMLTSWRPGKTCWLAHSRIYNACLGNDTTLSISCSTQSGAKTVFARTEGLSGRDCVQGAQLEPQLGSPRFLLVVLELLVSSHVIMVNLQYHQCCLVVPILSPIFALHMQLNL